MNYWRCLTDLPRNLTLTAALLSAGFAYTADFGVADWGMSQNAVRDLESRTNLTPFMEPSYLIFEVALPGVDRARIVYQFSDGVLSEGRFLFAPANPLDASEALRQYQTISAMMTEQFGPPNSDQTLFADSEVSALSGAEYANELASDRLILKSSWRSASAIIRHQLAWNDNKPHHQLHYIPLNGSPTVAPGAGF